MSVPIALQLFSVRGDVQEDLPGTLKAIADIGYAGVEPYGYGGDALEWMGHSGTEIRSILDGLGLTCCGIHCRTDALIGDNLARTVEFNAQLGNRFLVVAADKGRMSSLEGIEDLATILESAADAVADAGMLTGYHAHGFDFEEIDGKQAWYRLFERLRPDVIMQLDIGNSAGGGGDPVDILRTFPGRARSVHLKDYGAPEGGVIGDGQADWPEIFRLCDDTQPVEWYVVEEGEKGGKGMDIPARSLAALRAMAR